MARSIFRAGEVLDMAIRIEEQGVQFYRQVSLAADLPKEVQKVFQFLLDQEHEHLRIFEAMRQELTGYCLPESYAGETESFLKSLVGDQVFTAPDKAGAETGANSDPFAAIDFGLLIEERSITFYQEMKKLVPATEQNSIAAVIDQEEDHKRRLEALRGEIAGR